MAANVYLRFMKITSTRLRAYLSICHTVAPAGLFLERGQIVKENILEISMSGKFYINSFNFIIIIIIFNHLRRVALQQCITLLLSRPLLSQNLFSLNLNKLSRPSFSHWGHLSLLCPLPAPLLTHKSNIDGEPNVFFCLVFFSLFKKTVVTKRKMKKKYDRRWRRRKKLKVENTKNCIECKTRERHLVKPERGISFI